MEETLHNGRLVRFGVFEVDLRSGELRKAGAKLKISGQPFQVLAILLENPGEIVTREDLLKRLWPDTFVDGDHNLNTAINKIREVLGRLSRKSALCRNAAPTWISFHRSRGGHAAGHAAGTAGGQHTAATAAAGPDTGAQGDRLRRSDCAWIGGGARKRHRSP